MMLFYLVKKYFDRRCVLFEDLWHQCNFHFMSHEHHIGD